MRSEKSAVLSLMILTLMLIQTFSILGAENVQGSAVIKVIDPFNEPMKGVEVLLSGKEGVFRFLTNSTGHAVFMNLKPGKYEVAVVFRDIPVFKGELNFPEERRLNVTALLARINLTLLNLDGKPVKGVVAQLGSITGKFNLTGSSNDRGLISFKYVPYSTLSEIKGYLLRIFKGSLTYLKRDLNVSRPSIEMNLSIPLINVKIVGTNLEGEPVPNIRISLSAAKFKTDKRASNGSALFENIPSSELEDIGPYRLNITLRTRAGEIPIYFEERRLTSSQQLYLIMDLARLNIKVLDGDGKPVKGVQVWLSNELAENFTYQSTDARGVARFENIPLSGGRSKAGKYVVQVVKGGKLIGRGEVEVLEPRQEMEVTVNRMSINLLLRDYENKPLSNYEVALTDMETGESFNATTGDDGSASLKLFFGNYWMEVWKNGYRVYRRSLRISNQTIRLRIASINFPYILTLKDCFGNPVRSGTLKIKIRNETIHESPVTGEPIRLKLPHPALITVDIYGDNGDLIERRSVEVEGPGTREIRLQDYVYLGGLVPLEDAGFWISTSLLILVLATSAILLYRRKP